MIKKCDLVQESPSATVFDREVDLTVDGKVKQIYIADRIVIEAMILFCLLIAQVVCTATGKVQLQFHNCSPYNGICNPLKPPNSP